MSDAETEALSLQQQLLARHPEKTLGDLTEMDLVEFRVDHHLDMDDPVFGLVAQRWAAEAKIGYELDTLRRVVAGSKKHEAPRSGRAWRWLNKLFG